MRYPAYPRYKPSGIEWLGDVPEQWEVKRIKHLVSYRVSNVDKIPSEDELPIRLCNYTDVYNNDFITPKLDLMETTATVEEIRRFGLQKGDVIITKDSEDWRDIAVPALVTETAPDLVCGYHLAILRAHRNVLRSDYLLRAFQSFAINHQFQLSAGGVTRFGLPKSSIGESLIPLPDLSEQKAIAAFLDYQTKRIDMLVAKKRELIERLKEKRTALISQTVTRGLPPDAARAAGLDPYPTLKPSGIEWLGEIPEHWEIIELRRFTNFITSGSRGWAEYYSDEGSIFIRIGNLTRSSIDIDLSDVQYVTPPTGSEGERTRIRNGDILFSITAYLGSVAVAEESITGAYINQHIALVRVDHSRLEPRYVAYSTLGDIGQLQLSGLGYGGTKIQLSLDDVLSLRFCIPPIDEQRTIAAYLDKETAKIDALIAKVEEAIERLQEYRTALITAAVTGKIDVREKEMP